MTKPTQKAVKLWMLGVMAKQNMFASRSQEENKKDTDFAINASLMAFLDRYPREAFTSASMDAVCATEAYWSEAKVVKALDVWWSQNDPNGSMALPAEAESAPVSKDAKQWLAAWYRAKDDEASERALDLIRGQSREAFDYLVREEFRAANIAVMRHWTMPTRSDLAYEWDDPDGIEDKFQTIRAEIQRHGGVWSMRFTGIAYVALIMTVKIHAPQHLWMVDPKRLREQEPQAGPIVSVPAPVVARPPGLFD